MRTGVDFGVIGQRQEFGFNALDKLLVIAAGKIGPANGIGKECVSCEDNALVTTVEAYPAGRVAWGVKNFKLNPCKLYFGFRD